MVAVVFEDLRRIVLGLLFVVAFGWMAAQLMPGSGDHDWAHQQVAAVAPGTADVVPPSP